jgi:hypothetical protein
MEVRIGVLHAARELVLESNETADAVAKKVSDALGKGILLDLLDDKGRRVVVPAERLAYVEIAATEARRVGFGAT